MKNYSKLDDAIVAHIRSGSTAHPIYSETLLSTAANALGRFCQTGDEKEWRLIDRRLQALRKNGRIRLEKIGAKNRKWLVTETEGERIMKHIEQKHILALDCLRQFANEYFSVFEKFVQDEETPPQENHAIARDQIRLAEELHNTLEMVDHVDPRTNQRSARPNRRKI